MIFIIIMPIISNSNERLSDEELLKKGYKAIKRRYNLIHSSKFKPYLIEERSDTSVTITGIWNMPRNTKGGMPYVILSLNGNIIKISHGK